jgi:hypothetical protein
MAPTPRQRIDLQRTAPPIRAGTLKTNRDFLLVLPSPRLVNARWDHECYAPGTTARLLVQGQRLPALEVAVELEGPDGAWSEIDRSRAVASGDRDQAEGAYRFAPPAPPRQAEGHLTAAAFAREALEAGADVELRVESTGLEGAGLEVTVEREESTGRWKPVDTLNGTLRDGRCALRWRPPRPELPAAGIVECAFERGALSRDTAVLLARAPALEGRQLWFELERESAPGTFVPCGQAVATVHGGQARARIHLDERREHG